jgi:hypothetical protein
MRCAWPAFAFALIAGCTADNPDYIAPGSDGGDRDLSMKRRADLSGEPRDFATPGQCLPGQRQCEVNFTASESCVGGTFQEDRLCPFASTCVAGYCAPPAPNGTTQGDPCGTELPCATVAALQYGCQPFVDPNGTVVFRCAQWVGMGASGSACQSGADCRSGFCIAATGTCFRACMHDSDCPIRMNVQTVCRQETILVEGVPVTAGSCIFP